MSHGVVVPPSWLLLSVSVSSEYRAETTGGKRAVLFICLSLKLWVLCDEVALSLVFILAAASVVVVVFTVVVVVLVIVIFLILVVVFIIAAQIAAASVVLVVFTVAVVFNIFGRIGCALVGVRETSIAPGVRGYLWRPEQYVHQLREQRCSLCPAKRTGWYWHCRCVET